MNRGSSTSTRVAEVAFDEEDVVKKTRWRNLIAFWILGLCNNYGYFVMLSAAQDIIESKFDNADTTTEESVNSTNSTNTTGIRTCNSVSTGTILLADVMPSLAVKVIAPFLPLLVHARVAACVLISAAGFLLVSLSTTKWVAIIGIVLTSISFGLSEVTLFSYCNRFPKEVISTFSSGMGGAAIIGSVSYAGLRMVLSIENTLLVMLIVPVLQVISFWCILKHPAHAKVPITKNGIDNQKQIIKTPEKTFRDKMNLVPGLLKYIIPLGLVFLFQYFINQGLHDLIQFDGIWLTHAEQYRWLQVDCQIGVFIAVSSMNLIFIKRIWVISVLQFINAIILLFETIYYYIPNIWIVFAIVLWEGLLGGLAFVNPFHRIAIEIPIADRETSLGFATMADTIGISLAGWLAIPVHSAICILPQPRRLGS